MAQDPDQDISSIRETLLKGIEKLKINELKDLLKNKPIILEANTDPKKAIEILIENNIRAAPVREKKEWIGVLDLRDTVKYALQTYKKGAVDKEKAKAMEYLTTAPHITTNTLKYLSRMSQFKLVKESDLLTKLLGLLAHGCHIVGIVKDSDDGSEELITIVTQGQLFLEISKQWKMEDLSITLEELQKYKYITSPIKTIRYDMKAWEAFEKMSQYNLSGLAVVDNEGKIIHNTSATDIKMWLIASNSLEDTIERFLINIRKLSYNAKYPIAFCLLNDKLGKAFGKLQATRYHRLWVVDKDHIPTGVFALTDIFRLLCDQPKKK